MAAQVYLGCQCVLRSVLVSLQLCLRCCCVLCAVLLLLLLCCCCCSISCTVRDRKHKRAKTRQGSQSRNRDPKDTRALTARQGDYRVWRASQNLSGPEVASIGLHVQTDPPAVAHHFCFFSTSALTLSQGYWLLAAGSALRPKHGDSCTHTIYMAALDCST